MGRELVGRDPRKEKVVREVLHCGGGLTLGKKVRKRGKRPKSHEDGRGK